MNNSETVAAVITAKARSEMTTGRAMDKHETKRLELVCACCDKLEALPPQIGELLAITLRDAVVRPQEIRARLEMVAKQIEKGWGKAALDKARTAGMYRRGYRAQTLKAVSKDEQYLELANEYAELYAADESRDYGMAEAVRRSIAVAAKKLTALLEGMEAVLGGAPEACERGAQWGVGGYYNGVLVRGTKRVSFKSFYAGGYNIQRLHIRVRYTELKSAA